MINRKRFVFEIKENWHNKLVYCDTVSKVEAIRQMTAWYGTDNFLYLHEEKIK